MINVYDEEPVAVLVESASEFAKDEIKKWGLKLLKAHRYIGASVATRLQKISGLDFCARKFENLLKKLG